MMTLQGSKEGHGMWSPGKQGKPLRSLPLSLPCCPAGDPPRSRGWRSSPCRLCSLEAVDDHYPPRTNRSHCVAGLPRQCSNALIRTGRKCVLMSRQNEPLPRSGSSSPAWTLTQTQLRRDPCSAFYRMPAPLPRGGWDSRGLCQDQEDRRRGNRAGCFSSVTASTDRAPGQTPLGVRHNWTSLKEEFCVEHIMVSDCALMSMNVWFELSQQVKTRRSTKSLTRAISQCIVKTPLKVIFCCFGLRFDLTAGLRLLSSPRSTPQKGLKFWLGGFMKITFHLNGSLGTNLPLDIGERDARSALGMKAWQTGPCWAFKETAAPQLCTAAPPVQYCPFLLSPPIFAILTDNHHSQKHSPVCCCNNTTGQRGTLYLPLWGQVFKLKTSINLREQNMIAPSEFWSTSPNIIQRPSVHSFIMPNAPKINYPLSALPPESNLAFDGATSTEQIFKESRSLCDHCQWAACQLCNIIKHVYARCQRRSCGRRHEFIGIGGIWYSTR